MAIFIDYIGSGVEQVDTFDKQEMILRSYVFFIQFSELDHCLIT